MFGVSHPQPATKQYLASISNAKDTVMSKTDKNSCSLKLIF